MNDSTILIVTDAGAAGRALLGRKDLDTHWALTLDEALAVVEHAKPRACITREDMAMELLEALKRTPHSPPVVVLLEQDGWERRDLYFGLGATALASELAAERILEAVSELTGISFRTNPRVPFASVLDATIDEEPLFLETVELSASGVAVRGMPEAQVGDRAELNFVMAEPPVTVTAMVVRTYEHGGETVAGMCFVGLDDERRRALNALVEEQAKAEAQAPDPVGFTADLGAFTLDLNKTADSGEEGQKVYLAMLRESAEHATVVMPSWLKRVQSALTSIEKTALVADETFPSWALSSIAMRIHLKRERLNSEGPIAEAMLPKVVDHCLMIADQAQGAPSEVLVQAAQIRTALLREVYEPRRIAVGVPAASPSSARKSSKKRRNNSQRAVSV